MKTSTVSVIIALLVFVCFITYWSIPEAIQKQNEIDNRGYWGDVTGEFNWCEYNYIDSYYIAEPMNTFTSLLYSAGACLHFKHYKSILTNDLKALLWIVFLLGIGSTLFHGTLKYEMQILDELPLYIIASYSSIIFYHRHSRKLETFRLQRNIQLTVSLLLTLIFMFTDQRNVFHVVGRLFMMSTCAICFVYAFIAGCDASNEVDEGLKHPTVSFKVYFTKSFIYFIVGFVCWLLDNFLCPHLQDLPFGMPYPHLHSVGWHIGTVLGLHHLFFVMIGHHLWLRNHGADIKNKSIAWGLFTYLEITTKGK